MSGEWDVLALEGAFLVFWRRCAGCCGLCGNVFLVLLGRAMMREKRAVTQIMAAMIRKPIMSQVGMLKGVFEVPEGEDGAGKPWSSRWTVLLAGRG